jgi:hypothetical protein
MAINPYFSLYNGQTNVNEQDLIKGFVREVVQMAGIDMLYLPRTMVKVDSLFHEDTESVFNSAFTIETYIESFNEYGGEDMLDFGLHLTDTADFLFAQDRFRQITGLDSPSEGDLIFNPVSGSVFEIKFVENEKQFYPLGALPTFTLKCELFTYSGETFNTGTEVDTLPTDIDLHDNFEDNVNIETEAATIIDFSENNPFGLP